jgi:hypothetical protein
MKQCHWKGRGNAQVSTSSTGSCLLWKKTHSCSCHFPFFPGLWSNQFQWKFVILILVWKMGGTEQQDPKVFARITNYLYICVVLDLPLLIMKSMNWSMASGCLACVCANSWSIMYLSASPGCSAPSACRQAPTWLVINTSPTNWMAGGALPVGGLLDLMQHAKAAHWKEYTWFNAAFSFVSERGRSCLWLEHPANKM